MAMMATRGTFFGLNWLSDPFRYEVSFGSAASFCLVVAFGLEVSSGYAAPGCLPASFAALRPLLGCGLSWSLFLFRSAVKGLSCTEALVGAEVACASCLGLRGLPFIADPCWLLPIMASFVDYC